MGKSAIASGSGTLKTHDSQYRTGLSPVSSDRQGQDQAGPEEVHLSGRDDRQKGKGFRQHSDPADRNAELPLRPPEQGGVGQGEGEPGTGARSRRRRRRRHRSGRQRARRAHPRSGSHDGRTRADPRRRTRTAAHRAQGQRTLQDRTRSLLAGIEGRARIAAPLQADLQGSAEAPDHGRHLRSAAIRTSFRSTKTSATSPGKRNSGPRATRSSFT